MYKALYYQTCIGLYRSFCELNGSITIKLTRSLDSFLSASIRFSWLGGVSPNAIGISPFIPVYFTVICCVGFFLASVYTMESAFVYAQNAQEKSVNFY